MKHVEGNFNDSRGTEIYYQYWLPEGDVKAVILIVHGLFEHSGRYMNVVNHFVPLGYAVYGMDHSGHGRSGGRKNNIESFDEYLDALKIYFAEVQGWQKGKPLFLLGHSMGGLIAATFLVDNQDQFSGAILSGPAAKIPDDINGVTIAIGKLLSKLLPNAGLISLDVEGVSRDPKVVQAYIDDPFTYKGKTPARLAAELLSAMENLQSKAAEIKLPLLIIQGSADRLVNPAGAQFLYDTVSSADKTLKMYEGLYHEVLNEPEKEQGLGDIESWLEQHLIA